MRHPPYHLRPKKAIDRILLLKAIEKVGSLYPWDRCEYFGFGGPFLDDVRVICDRFPNLRFVSIESSSHTHKRQEFHKNTKNLELVNKDLNSYLKHDFPSGDRCIFWLDYTDLKPRRLDEFMALLPLVAPVSIVKISLQASVEYDRDRRSAAHFLPPPVVEHLAKSWVEDFQRQFDDYLPRTLAPGDFEGGRFPSIVQEMLQIAASKALPAAAGLRFQPVHSCSYADAVQMYSLTGVICEQEQSTAIQQLFRGWRHANLDWSPPQRIDVPLLSVKERLLLEKHLPIKDGTGRQLHRVLGYNVDDGSASSRRKLKQYEEFYQYFPLFAKLNF